MSRKNILKLMLMRRFLTLWLAAMPLAVLSQMNIDSVSHIDYMQLHDTYLNDVWGYTDETGGEYVLVGARKGTSIVDISTPANAHEIYWLPGSESVWRDLSSWQDYAYITTEAQSGLLILDMTSLPDPSGITAHYYLSDWSSAHTLFIDANGYAYIFGANRGNGGVIILDVHTDPLHPVEVGTFDNWYCHDGYVLNDTMYLAHIADGFISIVDITDKSNPVLLGTKATTNNFSHNIWTTPDGNIGFTTDEVSGAYIGSYDLSDPQNIVQLDLVQSSPGKGVIPHNTHVRGDFIITSYYSDGITIHDVSRPDNMIMTGNYDTYPGQTISFDGCWGVFPFFPSGTIAATDISEGLFILAPDYVHASYLEGLVTDASNSNPLTGVSVRIQNDDQTEISKSGGVYKTGIMGTGTYSVTFSKVAYFPQTIQVSLASGNVTTLNVQLEPMPPYPLNVVVKETGTDNPVFGAQVKLEGALITHDYTTNGLGEADAVLFYDEQYHVSCGKWGYKTTCEDIQIDEATGTLTLHLEKGIYDDFTFDFGWTTAATQNVTTGMWVREKPNPTAGHSAPGDDAQFDCGNIAFVTGNSPNLDSDADDVDHGRVTLYSPMFDLTGFSDPYINYVRWFYNFHGPMPPPDDTLEIRLSNGATTVRIDAQGSMGPDFHQWIPKSIRVSDLITPTATMQLIVTVADEDPAVNITEAGFDFFYVSETSQLGVPEQAAEQPTIYPNPTEGIVYIDSPRPAAWEVYSLQGTLLQTVPAQEGLLKADLSGYSEGIYLLRSEGKTWKVIRDR